MLVFWNRNDNPLGRCEVSSLYPGSIPELTLSAHHKEEQALPEH